MSTNNKEKLQFLKDSFKYDSFGVPDIYSFGVFKVGLTGSEIEDYIRVRFNKWNVRKELKKFNDNFGRHTCPAVSFDSQTVCLFFRHDVERMFESIFNGEPTYFD